MSKIRNILEQVVSSAEGDWGMCIAVAEKEIQKLTQQARREVVEEVKEISDTEIDGSYLPEGSRVYYEKELEALLITKENHGE